MLVLVDRFQPFQSRVGKDKVIRLRFAYDERIVERLKEALREARQFLGVRNPGGWLAAHEAWFVEPAAWEHVKYQLEELGCRFGGKFKAVERALREAEGEARYAEVKANAAARGAGFCHRCLAYFDAEGVEQDCDHQDLCDYCGNVWAKTLKE
jgi:hypothetical protein